MEIKTDETKHEIRVGDVFINNEFTDSAYMLVKVSDMDSRGAMVKDIEFPYQLFSLTGNSLWSGYKAFDMAVKDIERLIGDGVFRHYSKDSYVLQLQKKG